MNVNKYDELKKHLSRLTEPEHWRNLLWSACHYRNATALSANRNSKDAGRCW